jgi:hypothetical protein
MVDHCKVALAMSDLTLEYLKQYEVFHAGPSIAGVLINHDEAYHFYTAEAPRLIDDLHSHKRSYTSTVIRGEVKNHIYEIRGIDPTGGKLLVNTDCELLCGHGGCAAHRVVERFLNVVKVKELITKQGETYGLTFMDFHKFELVSDGPVITHMHYSKILQPETQIIVDESYLTNKCNPPEVSDEVLWSMVESCLENTSFEYELDDGNVMGFM